MNETLQIVDGRTVLRFERRLSHPVEKVWRAVTEPAQLSHWFPSDMEMDFRPGGKIRFVFREGEGEDLDGEILELDPPRVFAYTWGDSVLRWELRPDGHGCLLTFTHTFDDRPSAASFATGWALCLEGLDSLLAGERPGASLERWPDLHEGYVERFDLQEGDLRQAADGWVVRFERQLIKPVDEVWALLTEGGAPVVGEPPPVRFTNGFVPAGPVTAVEPPRLLEYQWRADDQQVGRVRWELSGGPGGARLVLTQTVPERLADQRPTALAAWHTRIELLADRLRRGQPHCWPEGRTEELMDHYAKRIG